MADYTSTCQLARRLGVKPRVLTDLFYSRVLDDARCPIVGTRRIIPADYIAEIERALVERGIIRETAGR